MVLIRKLTFQAFDRLLLWAAQKNRMLRWGCFADLPCNRYYHHVTMMLVTMIDCVSPTCDREWPTLDSGSSVQCSPGYWDVWGVGQHEYLYLYLYLYLKCNMIIQMVESWWFEHNDNDFVTIWLQWHWTYLWLKWWRGLRRGWWWGGERERGDQVRRHFSQPAVQPDRCHLVRFWQTENIRYF